MSDQPSLPYGGGSDPNSGFAGSPASEARARIEDRTGVTQRRQRQVLAAVRRHGEHGRTWREVAVDLNLHHGQASGALSNLHKTGRLARLVETRQRCHIYVVPEAVDGRPTGSAGRTSGSALLAEMAALLIRWQRDCGHRPYPVEGCLSCDTYDALSRYERTQ